ncbi:MAG TPA: ADOP family duplicated permease [Bryobacteraceae bacterium]|jgi:predicted permease|nr:ADOP family duplicated permease [Bryobacteraceae bacterium]
MRWASVIHLRLRSLFSRHRVERELDEEMRYHLEREINEEVAAGMKPEDARYAALRSMENIEQRKEECRDMRGLHGIDNMARDLRYAAHQLVRSPAFTITVLATLALCIGANTAIYTIVDTLFFRPLPYPDSGRLVLLSTVFSKGGAFDVDTSQDGFQWELARDHASLLESAVYSSAAGVNLVAGGRVEYVINQRVSANYFHVLGINPLIGREFTRQEDVANGPALTILSYGIWQRVFHGEPGIVGHTIDLRGSPHTIIGIIPAGFRSLPAGVGDLGTNAPIDVWTPLRPSHIGEGSGDNYGVIARLKPGATAARANGQLNSIMQDYFSRRHFPTGMSAEERALPLQTGLTYDLRSSVHLMWGAVLLILVIGCVNIAGILLARSAARSREIATRMAIGAGRARVISQLLAEALLLALLGGAIGLGLGYVALEGLIRLNPGEFNMFGQVHLDLRVTAVMLTMSLATSIIFGLFPALDATTVDLRSALAEAGRGSAGSRRQWKRQLLVFIEVALGVVLVVAAGLLIRSFATLVNANPGFDPNHVITASASLQDARYNTTAAGSRLFRESLERIRQIPGVESAAVALTPPYARALNEGVNIIGSNDSGVTNCTYATRGMFETLHMHLLRGRLLTDADNAHTARVAVVNESFVTRYLRNQPDPLGTSIRIENKVWQIVGIVNNVQVKMGWGGAGPLGQFAGVYIPVDQFPDGIFAMANVWFSPVWIVRTRGNTSSLPESMQRALQSVDPRLPFSSFKSMLEVRGASLKQQRYQAMLFLALAALTVLLVALGVYGLIANSVAQRTREMGIRLALGATPKQVVYSAVAPGIALSLAGIGCGIVLALFATRLLKSLIWSVSGTDPLTFISVAVLLILVAAVSSAMPALRLTRLDPAQTLRDE